MDKELSIAVIHGIGSQKSDFAEPMIREINSRIFDLKKEPDKIAWKRIFWADVLEARQLQYLRDAERSGDLDFKRLRKFVLTAFGDATAYQKVQSSANTTYEEIHAKVEKAISDLFHVDLASTSKPLIVMAHSLGGHIMSNYIWDIQSKGNPNLSSFEQMQTLAGMITFGCNIPLFTFAYKEVIPIKFPGSQLSTSQKKKAKWLNFYDPDDVLGYPLKPISPLYKQTVTKDIPINVGGVLASWNPVSHIKYWTDNDFTRPTAKFIASFL